jgi:sec-independent protein translocase protein TatA
MIGDLFDSPWKILIIAALILVLFGAKKMPEAARSLGKSMRILKTEVGSLHQDEPAASSPVQPEPVPAFPQVQLAAAQPQPDHQSQIDALQQQVRDLQRAATMDASPSASAVQAGVAASESGRTQQPG